MGGTSADVVPAQLAPRLIDHPVLLVEHVQTAALLRAELGVGVSDRLDTGVDVVSLERPAVLAIDRHPGDRPIAYQPLQLDGTIRSGAIDGRSDCERRSGATRLFLSGWLSAAGSSARDPPMRQSSLLVAQAEAEASRQHNPVKRDCGGLPLT